MKNITENRKNRNGKRTKQPYYMSVALLLPYLKILYCSMVIYTTNEWKRLKIENTSFLYFKLCQTWKIKSGTAAERIPVPGKGTNRTTNGQTDRPKDRQNGRQATAKADMIKHGKNHIIIYNHIQHIQARKAVNILYNRIKAYKHTENGKKTVQKKTVNSRN